MNHKPHVRSVLDWLRAGYPGGIPGPDRVPLLALLRDTPAVGGHGWRHGVLRYRDEEASFYRLSSLRLWPDRRLNRRGLEIVGRRSARGDEADIMTAETVVLELQDSGSEHSRRYELALDRGALTAFLSWFESRPSPRATRRTA